MPLKYYQRVFVVDIQFRDIGDRLAAVGAPRAMTAIAPARSRRNADACATSSVPCASGSTAVVEEMQRIVTADLPLIEEVNGHLLQMRGKMFRPTLALLASERGRCAPSRAP